MIYLKMLALTFLGFCTLWAITRVLGKKQISQLTLFDYITGITIGSVTADLIEPEGSNWVHMLVALVAWGALTYLFHWVGLKGRTMNRAMDGSPTLLVDNGQILEANLSKIKLNIQELMSLLRVKGHFSLDEVELAFLETNGQLSVKPKSQFRPVQPRDLQLGTGSEGMPVQVMQEGRAIAHGLEALGRSAAWLQLELQNRNIAASAVFSAWADPSGRLTVDLYQDQTH